MMPDFDRDRQCTILAGAAFGRKDLSALMEVLPEGTLPGVRDFLTDWFSITPAMRLRTSGSTGTPKEFFADKERMRQSARLTCETLGLKAGDSALVCMPLDFIAGKMMMVRALVAGLDLYIIPPCGNPLARLDRSFDFTAMVPLQVYNSLKSPEEKARLSRIGTLLIGGGAIDPAVETELAAFPGAVYATYGMTETLSHIALRRISAFRGTLKASGNRSNTCTGSGSSRYVPFPSISLSLTDEGALIIDAPLVCEERLITRDRARIHPDGSFEILGRLDNVINTGGIKVQIEEVETRLSAFFTDPFAVTSVAHEKYGEAVALLVQGEWRTEFMEEIRRSLPSVMRPKIVFTVKSIPITPSGKICRSRCRELAKLLAVERADTNGSNHLPPL